MTMELFASATGIGPSGMRFSEPSMTTAGILVGDLALRQGEDVDSDQVERKKSSLADPLVFYVILEPLFIGLDAASGG